MLRKEGPGSTVKIWHDNDIVELARNDMIEFRLVSNEGYQELLNRSADSIQLSVSLRGSNN